MDEKTFHFTTEITWTGARKGISKNITGDSGVKPYEIPVTLPDNYSKPALE